MVEARAIAALGAIAALLLSVGVAAADTSSWAGRVDPAAPIEKKKKAPAAKSGGSVPVIKARPVAAHGTSGPVLKPPVAKGHQAKAQAAAESDPAYEAFEQGHYLTALELGVKGAELGEPQAHTLVGRIYSEGLGVAPNAPLAAQWFARGA
ncbi:MAG TPA: hypothetical protein VFY92_07525, partial [Hyphomicrobiaceae bacterium]|nr:hypothetical protein [Hyphomicrobiaceae bacterium]